MFSITKFKKATTSKDHTSRTTSGFLHIPENTEVMALIVEDINKVKYYGIRKGDSGLILLPITSFKDFNEFIRRL